MIMSKNIVLQLEAPFGGGIWITDHAMGLLSTTIWGNYCLSSSMH